MSPEELELASTDDLINALRSRSKAFFCMMKPLGELRENALGWSWGVDGQAGTSARCMSDSVALVAGYVDLAKLGMLQDSMAEDYEETDPIDD